MRSRCPAAPFSLTSAPFSPPNEAELAGVIAHEMAHVYMQHSIKAMREQGTTQAAGQILGGMLGAVLGGTAGALANLGAQVGAGVISMKYSRADEAQADAVGAIIMYKAGYNPIRLAQFFQKLEKEGGSRGPNFLSDHPNPGNRVQAVQNEVKNWPPRQYVDNSPQFAQVKQAASKVRAYSAEEIQHMAKTGQIQNTDMPQGVSARPGPMGEVSSSQVIPSGSYQTYQGPGPFTMDYPSNWQPAQDQQSASVLFAPPAGVSQSGIAYGVMVSQFQPQGANSLDDATQQLIASLQQQNPGLRGRRQLTKHSRQRHRRPLR
jgi:hypothetical protein